MRDRLADLGASTAVALVTFTDPSTLAAYRDEHALAFPVLRDPDRTLYRAYGLGRGRLRRIWNLAVARRYVEVLRDHGLRALRRPVEDTRQLGGDFVLAPDGTLAWGFWSEGPDDRPSVDEIVAAVRATLV